METTYDREALLDLLGIPAADRGKGAKTKLTEAEWVEAASNRHGFFVLVVDHRVETRDNWTRTLGRFTTEDKAGHRVRVMSHTDFVTRLVQFLAAE